MFADPGAGGGALVYANGAPVAFPNMMPLLSGSENFGFPHMVSHISAFVYILHFPILSVDYIHVPVERVIYESS